MVTKTYFSRLGLKLELLDEKYCENGQEILNEDGESFSELEFKEYVKTSAQKVINKNFDQIVLLAGAGTSVEETHTLGKTMADLSKCINDKLKTPNFTLEELVEQVQFEKPVDKDGNFSPEKLNLENFISRVFAYKQFLPSDGDIKKTFESTVEEILSEITKQTSYEYDSQKLSHSVLINVLAQRLMAPNRLSIVTTNYDVMFEGAAKELGYTIIDGFTFSDEPYFDSDEFEWQLVRRIPNVKTKELEYKPNVLNLLKIHGSITWKYDEETNKVLRKSKTFPVGQRPLMIFPSSQKYAQTYTEPYFDLFTKFQDLLRENNTLLITSGFSFGDEHIAQMIESAIKRNKGLELLVTDPDLDKCDGDKSWVTNGWKTIEKLERSGFAVSFLKSQFSELNEYVG